MDFGIIIGNALRSAFGPNAAIFALAAVGLNLHFGYGGLANFGQIGFVMLGAYGVAVSVATFGWSMWVGLLVGLALCAIFALLLGIPTLRLRGDYLAITTIAAAEILRLGFRSTDARELTGGPFGLQSVANSFYDLNPISNGRYGWGTFQYTAAQLWTMIVGWVLVLLSVLFVWALMRSPWGRVVKSIREDEDAVRSLGKNSYGYKIQVLVIGGVIGGLAGIIDVFSQSGVSPLSYRSEITFFFYAALILGGAATRIGPVLGAVLFWFLRDGIESFIRELDGENWVPNFLASFLDGSEGPISVGLVGLGLMLLMIFRPQGIVGDREEMQLDV